MVRASGGEFHLMLSILANGEIEWVCGYRFNVLKNAAVVSLEKVPQPPTHLCPSFRSPCCRTAMWRRFVYVCVYMHAWKYVSICEHMCVKMFMCFMRVCVCAHVCTCVWGVCVCVMCAVIKLSYDYMSVHARYSITLKLYQVTSLLSNWLAAVAENRNIHILIQFWFHVQFCHSLTQWQRKRKKNKLFIAVISLSGLFRWQHDLCVIT